ncbi:11786_t:CDS:2 [Gigaspora rosea]|nr:11786_t:CDS:2 [Gigaspora rosea]
MKKAKKRRTKHIETLEVLLQNESDNSVEIVDVISDNNNEQEVNIEKIETAVSVEYPPTDPEGYAIGYNFIESNNYSIANDDQTQKAMKDKA